MKNIENRRRERLSEADGVVAANKTLCLAISYGGRDDIVQVLAYIPTLYFNTVLQHCTSTLYFNTLLQHCASSV
jgi:hypothetical protein